MSNSSQLVMDAGVALQVRELRDLNGAERAEQQAWETRRLAIPPAPSAPRLAPWTLPSQIGRQP